MGLVMVGLIIGALAGLLLGFIGGRLQGMAEGAYRERRRNRSHDARVPAALQRDSMAELADPVPATPIRRVRSERTEVMHP